MTGFAALVYICALAVPAAECSEATAIDVMQIRVASELACTNGWQEVLARSAFAEGIGRDSYAKTTCRRIGAAAGRSD